jgi:dihydroorotase
LLLTDESVRSYDTVFKVNPPLRTQSDVDELRRAVADGTIDIVATDHAPHPTSRKDCTWHDAAFGMVGLESALSVVQSTLVDTGAVSWADVARIMSVTPAAIGRVPGYANPLAVGSPANITLIDPAYNELWTAERLRGQSTNTPYLGRALRGRVVATIFHGRETVVDGALVDGEQMGTT